MHCQLPSNIVGVLKFKRLLSSQIGAWKCVMRNSYGETDYNIYDLRTSSLCSLHPR